MPAKNRHGNRRSHGNKNARNHCRASQERTFPDSPATKEKAFDELLDERFWQARFRHSALRHWLEKVVQGDMRAATGTQEFAATAPLNLVYVVDQSKQPGDFDARRKLVTACTDAGFIGENVYLFCASEGLGTVFRAMINANYIQQCLKLPVLKKVLYAQSVGYPSKS